MASKQLNQIFEQCAPIPAGDSTITGYVGTAENATERQ